MPKHAAAASEPLSVLLPQDISRRVKAEAADLRRPASHVVNQIVSDHFNLFDLPRMMVDTLEHDREERRLSRREYLMDLLDGRYRELLGVVSPRDARE